MVFDTSPLSAENVLRDVHDPQNQRLRVDSTVTAVIENVQMHVEIDAADGDNIAISDGTNTLDINADGSANVKVLDTLGTLVSSYNEVTSVASNTPTVIQTYTAGTSGYLQKICVSGTNIAMYELLLNASVIDKKRTWFGNSLNTEFMFTSYSKNGLPFNSGDVVQIKVTHIRPDLGDFNSRIQVVEL